MASSQSNMLASLGKMTELKQRLLFVVGALIVFRLGSFIPIPGVNPAEMKRCSDDHGHSAGCWQKPWRIGLPCT